MKRILASTHQGVLKRLLKQPGFRRGYATSETGLPPTTVSSRYDGAGNLTQRTTPAGSVLTCAYDALHRLTSKVTLEETTSYTYDPVGNRRQRS